MKDKGKTEIEKQNRVLEKLSITYVPIKSIKPNEYNPNRQGDFEFDLLLKSMKEDGFTQPIICQKDGRIVDGEHRWRAAKTLGYKEIPVVFVDMTDEQRKISTLRHNRARGTEDVELTAALFKDLEKLGAIEWAKDSLKLSDIEIDKLLNDIPVSEALAGDEYSKAWIPVSNDEKNNIKLRESEATSGIVGEALSLDGYNIIRKREELIKKAKSEEDRIQIQKDTQVYRLTLIFSKEQIDIVKEVLGDNPAQKVFEICQNERIK